MIKRASSHVLDRRQVLRGAGVLGGAGAIAVVTAAAAPAANAATDSVSLAVLAKVETLGLVASVLEAGSTYANRPATTAPVIFMGTDAPAANGTTAGGTAAAVPGLDFWFKKA